MLIVPDLFFSLKIFLKNILVPYISFRVAEVGQGVPVHHTAASATFHCAAAQTFTTRADSSILPLQGVLGNVVKILLPKNVNIYYTAITKQMSKS